MGKHSTETPKSTPAPLREDSLQPLLPMLSSEQLAKDIREHPEDVNLRLAYAAAMESLGNPLFATFIREHVAYSDLSRETDADDASLIHEARYITDLFRDLKESYFVPPAVNGKIDRSSTNWTWAIENGLLRETHLLVHKCMGDLYFDFLIQKSTAEPWTREIVPFEPYRAALKLQPLAGLSIFRGPRELDLFRRFDLLQYVSEVDTRMSPEATDGLIDAVLEASPRIRALVVCGTPSNFDTLLKFNLSESPLLMSLKLVKGSVDAASLAPQRWHSGLRELDFHQIRFCGEFKDALIHSSFPRVTSLTVSRCENVWDFLTNALDQRVFPSLKELWMDDHLIEGIARRMAIPNDIELKSHCRRMRALNRPVYMV